MTNRFVVYHRMHVDRSLKVTQFLKFVAQKLNYCNQYIIFEFKNIVVYCNTDMTIKFTIKIQFRILK